MKNRKVRVGLLIIIVAVISLLCGCGRGSAVKSELPIVAEKALSDLNSPHYAHYHHYPQGEQLALLPIGMFDSGTGGITVLEQFLELDLYNNLTGEEGADGIPDFMGENFIYLADQANMPYGLYDKEGKSDYLKELIIKDALFLTTGEEKCKIVVIGCNTATAWGLEEVRELLNRSETGVKVIGVIEAGVDGAMSPIDKERESFAVGVMATVGTIASNGYQNTIVAYGEERGYSGDIRVVAHGGAGFAEAVDSEPDFISIEATTPRESYRGPKWGEEEGIDPALLSLYNFDTSNNALLVSRDGEGEIVEMQLNSTGNYARFHMVSILEKHRRANSGVKMSSLILGCTHYPYLLDTLAYVVEELRVWEEDGVKPFEELLDEELLFIDPAVNTAKECYLVLRQDGLLQNREENFGLKGFISIPSPNLPKEFLDNLGNLSFNFKYGRELDEERESVIIVPFSKENINSENLKRIEKELPLSYSLIKERLN